MDVVILICHGLTAIALLGAITHQGLGVWRDTPAPARLFVDRFRAVPGVGYANAVVVLYITTFALGAYIYPAYVMDAKRALFELGLRKAIFVFQMKEHIAVIGLSLLAAYWYFWRQVPLMEHVGTRRILTTVLLAAVWWNLVIGHILNNIRGIA